MAEKFAVLHEGTVVQLMDAKPVLHPDLEVREVSATPDVQVGWRIGRNGALGPPEPMSAHMSWVQARGRAQMLLQVSDLIVLRLMEKNIPVPMEWQNYRQALRTIAGHPDTSELANVSFPPQPPKPTGI